MIVTIGLALGQIDREIVSVTALTLVITSTISTYMVIANQPWRSSPRSATSRPGFTA